MAEEREVPELPELPNSLINPDQTNRIMYTVLRKKLQMQIGSSFKMTKDEIKKSIGIEDDKAIADMMVHSIRLARVAANSVFDELEERYQKKADTE